MSEYRRPGESRVSFEIDPEYTPLAGVAILSCSDKEGKPIVAKLDYGDIRAVEVIGLLTAALDQVRYDFMDKSESEENEDEDEWPEY